MVERAIETVLSGEFSVIAKNCGASHGECEICKRLKAQNVLIIS